MNPFLERLNYSLGNEDSQTEQRALKTNANNRVLCITASGDRPLHLLMDPCQEVISIDTNKLQTYLLQLKVAAMQQLSYPEYLAFLGASPCKKRLETFARISQAMEPTSQTYWQNQLKAIEDGILYQGTVEKLTQRLAKAIKFFRGSSIKELFSFTDIEKQRKFIRTKWNRYLWKKAFEIVMNPKLSRFFLKDPGLFVHVTPNLNVGEYFYSRMNQCLSHSLARESTLLSLFLNGTVGADAFPPYLTEKGFNAIKPHLGRLKSHSIDLIQFLKNSPDQCFDRFSLSDVASYISEEEFNTLLNEVYRTAKPGARFSIRQFLSNHKIPDQLNAIYQRETELEQQLEKEDRCFVYRFMVGTIKK